ncbi:BTAD domain-containing putative transcriptional regulator [Actinokineospora soli]|uniref:BTAD domain-containing putative transcriptional regulator n=1 Tax=Actinokineospora soli TaxID=1048753 RepID=A0ABW2TVG0_9PSEU
MGGITDVVGDRAALVWAGAVSPARAAGGRGRRGRRPRARGRLRVLLASLAYRSGRPVPVDDLRRHMWGEPDAGSAVTVRSYVRRLRTALGDAERVRSRPPGYLLAAGRAEVDVLEFEDLAARAATAADPETEAALLGRALALWRGAPLADVHSDALHREVVPVLVEGRIDCAERLVAARLSLGEHAAVVGALGELTREHPLRERFWQQRMVALHRSGRQAEALAAFRDLRERLDRDLGIDVSQETREVHQAVLTGDAAALARRFPVGRVVAAPRPDWPPRELCPDIPDFVGRAELIGRIERWLVDGPRLVALSGPPGTGKTALATRVAHRVADRFPDGQLVADLGGPDAERSVPASVVLTRFLGALGVDRQAIPDGMAAQSALFRSVAGGKRLLVLLDNVARADQVRPLIPGGTSAVLVTSRTELTGLAATEGARCAPVPPLTPAESAALLRGLLDADDAELADLADVCAHLPLALRIAAAHLAARPGQPVGGYAGVLRRGCRVDLLSVPDDPQASVREAFDLSYTALSARSRRVFALLGLLPGLDFDADAAAAAAGEPDVESEVDRLVAASLVLRRAPGRYALHDLMRSYARMRCELDLADEGAAALARVFDHYLDRARSVDTLLRRSTPPEERRHAFADRDAALAWYERARPSVLALVAAAADAELPHAYHLPLALASAFALRKHWDEWVATHEIALRRARADGDAVAEGRVLHRLGNALEESGRVEAAIARHREALAVATDPKLRGAVFNSLGIAHRRLFQYDEASACYEQAMRHFRAEGNEYGVGAVQVNLASLYARMGRPADALPVGVEAVATTTRSGDPHFTTIAWVNLGFAHHLLGDTDAARAAFTTALELAVSCQDRYGEALARDRLACLGAVEPNYATDPDDLLGHPVR